MPSSGVLETLAPLSPWVLFLLGDPRVSGVKREKGPREQVLPLPAALPITTPAYVGRKKTAEDEDGNIIVYVLYVTLILCRNKKS